MIWYVNSTTGNDAYDGRTSGTAFKSLARAVDAAKPGDTQNCADGEYADKTPATDLREAFGDAFSVEEPDHDFLHDIGDHEQRGERDRLEGDGIHQRLVVETLGKFQGFGNEHDLRQHQRVHHGQTVKFEADVIARQNGPLVHEKHKKHEPEIGEYDEELPEFLISACAQAFLLMGRLVNFRRVDSDPVTPRACGKRGRAFDQSPHVAKRVDRFPRIEAWFPQEVVGSQAAALGQEKQLSIGQRTIPLVASRQIPCGLVLFSIARDWKLLHGTGPPPHLPISGYIIAPAGSSQTRKSERQSGDLSLGKGNGGARRDRTADLVNAIHALSQLSYGPLFRKSEARNQKPEI